MFEYVASGLLSGDTAPAVDAYALTVDRLWATAAALLGLAAVIVGVWAIRGAGRSGRWPMIVTVAGAVALVAGVVNLWVADGGPGTGNGVVGGGAAIVFGLAAVVLGLVARSKASRVED